ncbi:DUF805 domain-containing protein [Lactococcus cremoris]|uniref:DUF805 domain-containing protein n=1 Tax=Lactococcus lactis subsp. cremoris TaxID=1359 RepID=UPI00223B99F9|nr:DUF805 domain-containing protein [Lactococcus cremoris]
MIQVYIEYWKQYFNWSGRTTRKSFWWVFIMNLAIALTLILLYCQGPSKNVGFGSLKM